jgi:hypothetical protein
MALLVGAKITFEVPITKVSQAGPVRSNCLVEHGLHSPGEQGDLGAIERASRAIRPQRATKADLVRVDAADARDDPLVGQQSLERSTSSLEPGDEVARWKPFEEWVTPEVTQFTGYTAPVDVARHEPLPKGSRIDETQLCAVVERHQDMGVLGQLRALGTAGDVEQLAAHSQVNDQHSAVVQTQEQELAYATGGLKPPAGQTTLQFRGRLASHRAMPAHFDLADPAPDNG